jgi:flagellar motor switch protein FliN/FliY
MEQRQAQTQTIPPPAKAAAAPAAGFTELKADGRDAGKAQDMDFLLDIPLEITVELGRSRMIIKDLLQLGQGSVLELEKIAGEPMDILVNNKLVARGEVVVVNEKFGIRLTDIISPTERIRQLK